MESYCGQSTQLHLYSTFTANTYKHELNPKNPLGMHGKIAEAYADLIHNVWSGHNNSTTPRQFKVSDSMT